MRQFNYSPQDGLDPEHPIFNQLVVDEGLDKRIYSIGVSYRGESANLGNCLQKRWRLVAGLSRLGGAEVRQA